MGRVGLVVVNFLYANRPQTIIGTDPGLSHMQWSRKFRFYVNLERFLLIWAYFEPIFDDLKRFWGLLSKAIVNSTP